MGCTRFASSCCEMLPHSSTKAPASSQTFLGRMALVLTLRSNRSQTCTIGLRSGLFAGHGRTLCDDPPTLSAVFFLFALVFLIRMLAGGAGRVVSNMGHTWARVCPGINTPLPHSLRRLSPCRHTSRFGLWHFCLPWHLSTPLIITCMHATLTYTTDY